MAHSKGIENLPLDPLREIMTRVAQQPGGAADIARTFSVSKTFRDFVDDGDVLRSISFEDSFPCFANQYELLLEIGGLLVRCARAGNLSAQFILSKVVLASTPDLCSAKIEASRSYASLCQHFTPAELIDLVRTFLTRTNVEDIVEMQWQLKNFVVLFLVHGKKLLFQQFLDTLYQLCEKSLFPIVIASDPRKFVIEQLNGVCTMGHNMMGDIEIDEVIYRHLLECLVGANDDVVYEMLLERVDTVEAILKVGGQMASDQNNHDALLVNRGILCITAMLRGYLTLLIEHAAFIQSALGKLLAIFSALFDA